MKKVLKIEEGINPKEVACTTYQMRNPFRQFADACASELDVHCYFQHSFVANLVRSRDWVLDVCCGRGLLIPFLHYGATHPSLYVGVDAEPRNAVWRPPLCKDPRNPTRTKTWRFPTVFVESFVDVMAKPVLTAVRSVMEGEAKDHAQARFDFVVYTSSIEHMQPTAQEPSLRQCRRLARDGATMYLTCPVTAEGKSGWEVQYAAHLYEPNRSELLGWLKNTGWKVEREIGICTKMTTMKNVLTGKELEHALHIRSIMPRAQALPTIAALYPQCAAEMAYVCSAV